MYLLECLYALKYVMECDCNFNFFFMFSGFCPCLCQRSCFLLSFTLRKIGRIAALLVILLFLESFHTLCSSMLHPIPCCIFLEIYIVIFEKEQHNCFYGLSFQELSSSYWSNANQQLCTISSSNNNSKEILRYNSLSVHHCHTRDWISSVPMRQVACNYNSSDQL